MLDVSIHEELIQKQAKSRLKEDLFRGGEANYDKPMTFWAWKTSYLEFMKLEGQVNVADTVYHD